MGEDRQARLAKRLLTGAAYDHACFQMWLWYPLPDGQWEILFGRAGGEYHLDLWETQGRVAMARAWGVNPDDLGSGLGLDSIPTGYVNFEERMGRERLVLVVPETMPPGWGLYRLQGLLRCGNEIRKINTSARRNAQPEPLRQMIEILTELRETRPAASRH